MKDKLPQQSKTRIAPIDTWRAIAALGVVWIHCWTHFGNPSFKIGPVDLYKLIAVVGNGVDFFFVISGFCLFIVWRKKEFNLKNYFEFIKKRWLRIAPAFYAAAIFIALYLVFAEKKNMIVPILGNLLFIQNYSNWFSISPPFWSLAVEFHFYALIPFFIYFSRKNFFLTCIVTYFLSNILLWYYHSLEYHYQIETKGIHFFVGILLAWFFYEKQTIALKYFNKTIHFVLAIIILFSGRFLLSDAFIGVSAKHAALFKMIGVNLLVIGFALATWVTMVNDALSNWFSRRIGKWLGKLSYSIYLWHAFIIVIVAKYWPLQGYTNQALQPILFFCTVLFLLLPIATISYNLFEKFYFNKSKGKGDC